MRVFGVAVAVGALLLGGGVAAASAQPPPPPGSVTITLSPEQVKFLCEERLPRVQSRADRLIERINGGADVRGSVAWLKERAARERAAGREATAALLEERAERRAGQVDKLNKLKGWAGDFLSQHCGG